MRSLFPGGLPVAALGVCFCAAAAYAQDAAILRQNTFEVGPFGGISYGVDRLHGMGGANATYSILPNLLLYGEYSYFTPIEHNTTNTSKTIFNYNIPLQDFNFGVHVRFRIPKTPLVPYAVVGVGLLYSPSTNYEIQTVDVLAQNSGMSLGNLPAGTCNAIVNNICYNPPTPNKTLASTSFAFDYGAGVRWYIRENFGLRGEFKGYSLTGGPLHNPPSAGLAGGLGVNEVYRATVGFFFQF